MNARIVSFYFNSSSSDAYFSFIDEFMAAVTERWPGVLVQFEDFDNASALPILQAYRDKYTCFNDGILLSPPPLIFS